MTSETAKRGEMKLQINIKIKRVWMDRDASSLVKRRSCIHCRSMKGTFCGYNSSVWKKNQIMPQLPDVNLPSRQEISSSILGTVSHDVQKLNNSGFERKGKGRVKLARLRQTVPDNSFSKNWWTFYWQKYTGQIWNGWKCWWWRMKNNSINVIIKWDKEGECNSGKNLLPTKWNKQIKGSLRLDIGEYTILDSLWNK